MIWERKLQSSQNPYMEI